jgi:hypothetical protein
MLFSYPYVSQIDVKVEEVGLQELVDLDSSITEFITIN